MTSPKETDVETREETCSASSPILQDNLRDFHPVEEEESGHGQVEIIVGSSSVEEEAESKSKSDLKSEEPIDLSKIPPEEGGPEEIGEQTFYVAADHEITADDSPNQVNLVTVQVIEDQNDDLADAEVGAATTLSKLWSNHAAATSGAAGNIMSVTASSSSSGLGPSKSSADHAGSSSRKSDQSELNLKNENVSEFTSSTENLELVEQYNQNRGVLEEKAIIFEDKIYRTEAKLPPEYDSQHVVFQKAFADKATLTDPSFAATAVEKHPSVTAQQQLLAAVTAGGNNPGFVQIQSPVFIHQVAAAAAGEHHHQDPKPVSVQSFGSNHAAMATQKFIMATAAAAQQQQPEFVHQAKQQAVAYQLPPATPAASSEHFPDSKDRPYECNRCHKRFTRKGSLEEHKLTIHDGVKRWHCDECDRWFSKKGNLTAHKRVHSGTQIPRRPYDRKKRGTGAGLSATNAHHHSAGGGGGGGQASMMFGVSDKGSPNQPHEYQHYANNGYMKDLGDGVDVREMM